MKLSYCAKTGIRRRMKKQVKQRSCSVQKLVRKLFANLKTQSLLVFPSFDFLLILNRFLCMGQDGLKILFRLIVFLRDLNQVRLSIMTLLIKGNIGSIKEQVSRQ